MSWAIRVYFYSALRQFRDLLRATLLLVDRDLISAVFFCCRGLFELAAHAYYVKKHILQHRKANDLKSAWEFLFEINLGSRDMREKQKAQEGSGPDFPGQKVLISQELWPALMNTFLTARRQNKLPKHTVC